jgi:small membrane protein
MDYIQPIQIIAILFSLFAISRVFLRYKDKKLTINQFVFWCLIWASLILITLFPKLTEPISNIMGVRRGIDLFVYLSIALLFYIIFRIYVKADEQEQRITKLVRELAKKKK